MNNIIKNAYNYSIIVDNTKPSNRPIELPRVNQCPPPYTHHPNYQKNQFESTGTCAV